MAAGNDLGRLLTQLRNVSSPLERLKLISRAWRSVKRLDPRERAVLARQIGLDGAEELIEGIAVSRGGLNPSTVQRALDRLREVQPSRLKQTLQDLRDPERRRELIERGLDAATDVLAGPDAAEPEGPPPAVELAEDVGDAEVVEEAAVKAVPEPPAREPSAGAATVEAEPPSPAPRKPPEAAPPEPPRPQARKVEPAPAPPAVPAPGAANELFRLVEGEATLFQRLRALRENLELARESGPEELRSVLDLFAAGWARRRVVHAMIEARVPDSVEEAVFLIELLERKVDRRWCARTLLHEWELSAAQREMIASRHDGPGGTAGCG